jgi:iron complex outermembrane receptor protein
LGRRGAIDGARRLLGAGRWPCRLAGLAVIALLLLPAQPAPAANSVAFNIPAQPLAAALLELGRQAGLSIAVPENFPRDRISEPITGRLTANEALLVLLKDVPARFTFLDPETVAIAVEVADGTPPPSPRRVAADAIVLTDRGAAEEVIVTARRKEERLQAVPIAITAFDSGQLKDRNITSSQDLGLYVPSLVMNNNAGIAPGFVLRGQGSTLGAGPGVIAYFAEVPFINGQNATGSFQGGTGPGMFYDLESIQVLKGPQGTLFGRNTTGGAILFTPQKPNDDNDGYAQLTLGDYNGREVEAALNVPIVADRLLLRMSGDVSMRDGYTRDVGPYFPGRDYDNRDYWAFRLSLVARPSDIFENYLIASSLYVHQNGAGGSIFALKPGGVALSAFPAIADYLVTQQALGPRETQLSTAQIDKQWTYGAIDSARLDIGDDLAIKNIAGYQADKNSVGIIDYDGAPFAIQDTSVPNRWEGSGEQYSEELQATGKALGGRLEWTAGFYLEYDKPTEVPQYDVASPIETSGSYQPSLIVVRGSTIQRTEALYGQASYDLSGLWDGLEGLKFTAGLRYTWDYRSDQNDIYVTNLGGKCGERPGFFVPSCALATSGRFQAPTWTLALDYQLDPDTLVYATGRRGYKSGGFNLNTPDHSMFSTFQPELVTDVEIGLKADWTIFGASARTDIDAFHTDYTDIQRAISVLINGLSSPVTENAAVATIEGVEFEGTVLPTARTELSLAYSYLSSRYDTYTSPTLGDLSGLRFPFTPKNKISLTGRYHLPIGTDWGDLSLAATWLLQSSVDAGSDFDRSGVIGGYDLVNLRLDWKHAMGSALDLSLFATNAAGTVYRTRISALYNIFGVAGADYGEPRIFGAQLSYRFGP